MKTRHQLAAYMGLLGMTTLIAILWAIRDRLVAIGPWVLGVLLAVIGLVMLYLLHKLYVSFRKDRLALQARMYEVDGQKHALQLEKERWQIERAALLLNQQLSVSRIYPDTKGFMPMLVNVTEMGPQYINLPHPAHQARLAGQTRLQLPEQADSRRDQDEAVLALPARVRYEEVRDQIPAGHSLLGVSARGVETCEFSDLMTMLISGGSSTGKSNTVAIKLDEAMRLGRNTRMVVIDPHKNKPDSLYNKIRQYEPRFLMPVAQTDEDAIRVLRWFKGEFERRMNLSTEELEELDDVLLIIDEVFALCFHREDDQIRKLIKLVSGIAGYESRGYGMYAWFLTQKVTGLKWLRDAVMTTICHKMQTMSERKLAANDDPVVARDMDNWIMPGRVVVFGLNLPVTVTQMPFMKVVESTAITDEMEGLQPKPRRIEDAPIFRPDSPFMQNAEWTPGTPRYIEAEAERGDDSDAQNNALRSDSGRLSHVPSNVRTFPISGTQQPVAQSDAASNERPKEYRLTEAEIGQFLAAYRVSGSIDKALAATGDGKGARYRQHAREILAAYNTRQA